MNSGGTPACGMATTPNMTDLFDAQGACNPIPQPSDYSVTCPSPRTDTLEPGSIMNPWMGMELRVGEAEPGAFDGATGTGVVLVFYEVDNCDQTIFVTKQGSDLLVEGM